MNFLKAKEILLDDSLPLIQRAKEFSRLHSELVKVTISSVALVEEWGDNNRKLEEINAIARELFKNSGQDG